MTNEQYGTLKVEPRNQLADIEMTRFPHKEKGIVVARFGPNWYSENVKSMGNHFFNSSQFPDVTFRPATTSESISTICPDVRTYPELAEFAFEKYAKPKILNPNWFQAGRIVRWSDGVYINTLKAIKEGELDEKTLRELRDSAKPVGPGNNKIRLGEGDFAFAPYESFEQGVQDAGDFAEGGLARGLEYVEGNVATKLKSMASTYRNGVNVFNFDKCKEPTARAVGLYSDGNADSDRLYVYGDWSDDYYGCASGVVVSEPSADGEGTPKN